MTTRPRRTTTLAGPNRIVLGAATAGLVALASAGTALLVLTGTSSVSPTAEPAPPLPTSTPLTHAPGVVVLPSDDAGRLTGGAARRAVRRGPVFRVPPAPQAVPAVLAFTTDEPPPVTPVLAVPPPAPPPALKRAPEPAAAPVVPARPGRHLANGHAKHAAKHNTKHPKLHGKRVGWTHSQHRGNS
ncbi:MAG: hypothetical protein QOI82_3218 [Actinomycetota bacterium]|jgi:hypothetical protein|nr:hypothetical protein [Actinomycetota bacterium]